MKFIKDMRFRLCGRVYTVPRKIMAVICALSVLVCLTAGYIIMNKEKQSGITRIDMPPLQSPVYTQPPASANIYIYVHVAGAVMNPGLVKLEYGKRVADAVECAGGFSDRADIAGINLALLISDGMKIYIPAQGEEGAVITPPPYVSGGEGGESSGSGSTGALVNINTAGESELMSLSGIGRATAVSIIEYRNEHGNFKNIEDIMNVSGIGPSKFNAIRESICV